MNKHWERSTPLLIRVFGDPQPFPKKEVGIVGPKHKPRLMPVDRDYRKRKNPTGGKPIKYDHGYKRKWMKLVANSVENELFKLNLEPFPQNHPVAMGCLFFVPQAKSNKLLLPSQAPDEDNFLYAIRNALKRTPAKKGQPGKYPDGILFYEDDQIVWILKPGGKVWATEKEPPGVLITVQDAMYCMDEILKYQPNGELRFA